MADESPLAAFRKSQGWSQDELAEKLGVRSKGYISAIESGQEECSLRLALRIQKLSDGKIPASVMRPGDKDLADVAHQQPPLAATGTGP